MLIFNPLFGFNFQVVIDFKGKFNRYDYFSCLETALGKQLPTPEEIYENSAETQV